MEHAKLIKQLRKERNLTQQQLAEGITTRTTLSTFEKNATRISVSILFQYLNRMNVSIEEYEYLLNDHVFNEKKTAVLKYSDKIIEKTYDPEVEAELLAYYTQTGDFYFFSIYADYYMSRHIVNNLPLDQTIYESIVNKVTAHLDRVETWGRFELTLFINNMYYFDEDYVYASFDSSVKNMRLYNDSYYYKADIETFFVNGLLISYDHHWEKMYPLFRAELDKFIADSNSVTSKLYRKMFEILEKDSADADFESEKNRLLDTFEVLDMHYMRQYLLNHLEK